MSAPDARVMATNAHGSFRCRGGTRGRRAVESPMIGLVRTKLGSLDSAERKSPLTRRAVAGIQICDRASGDLHDPVSGRTAIAVPPKASLRERSQSRDYRARPIDPECSDNIRTPPERIRSPQIARTMRQRVEVEYRPTPAWRRTLTLAIEEHSHGQCEANDRTVHSDGTTLALRSADDTVLTDQLVRERSISGIATGLHRTRVQFHLSLKGSLSSSRG